MFLCLIGLSFVLDQFGLNSAAGYCIAAAWAAAIPAIAGAVGSIGSGIMNLVSQADANEANKQIAAENRQWQSGENQLSRDWQEKMWNAQNAYNTPSAMKARIKEAGWNPFLANSEVGSASNAGAAGSPSMQSAPNQPEMKPMDFGFIGGAANNAAAQYYNAKSVDANVANQQAQANKDVVETGKEIYRILGKEASQQYLQANLKPIKGSVEGSNFARQTVAQTAYDEAVAFRQELDNEIENSVGRQRASAVVQNLRKNTEYFQSQIDRLSKLNQVSDKEIEEISSNILRNIAQAFNLRRQGEYYEVSSKQLSLINQSLSMDLKEQTARFNFGSAIRDYMNNKNNAARNFSLWQNQFEAGEITNEIESNRVVRYGERIIDNVSKGLKVNFGFNNSRSTYKGEMNNRSYNNNVSWNGAVYVNTNR